jgi:predicted phosphodiesterase
MRLLVVSDLHGNIEALRAVVAAERNVDHVLCIGDIVDYGPSPDETVSWVREQALATVRGNHDNAVAFGEDCRSAPLFRRLSVETRKKTVPLLSAENLTYLQSLPVRRSVVARGVRLELLHAAPGDPLFQYLPASRVDDWREAAAEIDADLILVGHTHLPVVLDLGTRRVVNPGSVGLPRDGDPRACYAVIEDGEPILKRVAYDVDLTIAALRAWGLPDDVTRSLETLYRGGEPLSPFAGGQP